MNATGVGFGVAVGSGLGGFGVAVGSGVATEGSGVAAGGAAVGPADGTAGPAEGSGACDGAIAVELQAASARRRLPGPRGDLGIEDSDCTGGRSGSAAVSTRRQEHPQIALGEMSRIPHGVSSITGRGPPPGAGDPGRPPWALNFFNAAWVPLLPTPYAVGEPHAPCPSPPRPRHHRHRRPRDPRGRDRVRRRPDAHRGGGPYLRDVSGGHALPIRGHPNHRRHARDHDVRERRRHATTTFLYSDGKIGYLNPANGKTLEAVLAGPAVYIDNGDGTTTLRVRATTSSTRARASASSSATRAVHRNARHRHRRCPFGRFHRRPPGRHDIPGALRRTRIAPRAAAGR